MGIFPEVDYRLVTAHIVHHINGSNSFERYGVKSMTVKVVTDGGLPVSTPDEALVCAKAIIKASITAKLPCSGVFFAHLADAREDQPDSAENVALQLEASLASGNIVWLSKKGKMVVGRPAGLGARKSKSVHVTSAAEKKALAAFLSS